MMRRLILMMFLALLCTANPPRLFAGDLKPALYAVFETSLGNITAELFEKEAPETVANFVALARGTKEWRYPGTAEWLKRPLYNKTIFHRVIPGFMIQGGDPLGNGRGGPGYSFKDEFSPKLRHDRPGRLSMANAGPNTNGSQFFITEVPTHHLDDRHTIFGQVVEGMDVVLKIARVKRDTNNRPYKEVILKELVIKDLRQSEEKTGEFD